MPTPLYDYVCDRTSGKQILMYEVSSSLTPLFTGLFDTGTYIEVTGAASLPSGYTLIHPPGPFTDLQMRSGTSRTGTYDLRTLVGQSPITVTQDDSHIYIGAGSSGGASGTVQALGEVNVDLTAGPGIYPVYTVASPAMMGAAIVEVLISCVTAMTGSSLTSTIQIGTSGGSYTEIMGSGYSFNTATSSSLIPSGKVSTLRELIPVTTASGAAARFIQPLGTTISVKITGSALTTGVISVIILGALF